MALASAMAASKSATRITCSTGPNSSASGRRATSVTSISAGVRNGLVVDLRSSRRIAPAALADQVEEGLLELVGGVVVDHRAHERRRAGVGMVDDQPVDQLDDRLDQLLVLAVLDDQPPRRGAALAGAQIGGLDGDRGGGVDVARVPDDERIVAAHFEREDLVRRLGELAVEGEAGARRAGEEQAVEPGMARRAPCRVSGPPWTQRTTPSGTPAS